MEVVDAQQVDVEVAAAFEQLGQDPALGGLRAGMPMRKASVGATSMALMSPTGPRWRGSRPVRGAVHVEVRADVDQVGR